MQSRWPHFQGPATYESFLSYNSSTSPMGTPKDSTQPPIRAFSMSPAIDDSLPPPPGHDCTNSLQTRDWYKENDWLVTLQSVYAMTVIFLLWPFPLSCSSVYLRSKLGRLLWHLFLILLLLRNPCWDVFCKSVDFSVFTPPVWILSIFKRLSGWICLWLFFLILNNEVYKS